LPPRTWTRLTALLGAWGRAEEPWHHSPLRAHQDAAGPTRNTLLAWGTALGLIVIALGVALWTVKGLPFTFHIDAWNAGGNVLSNFYEEVAYRGLICGALCLLTRRGPAAVLGSALLFAWTHGQYPPWLQAYVGVAGALFAAGYVRTGSLLAPWWAHRLSDLVLDAILEG